MIFRALAALIAAFLAACGTPGVVDVAFTFEAPDRVIRLGIDVLRVPGCRLDRVP